MGLILKCLSEAHRQSILQKYSGYDVSVPELRAYLKTLATSKVNLTSSKGSCNKNQGGKKTPASSSSQKFPKCGRCGSETPRHATKDCDQPQCSFCKKFFHVIENCYLNPNSLKYKPSLAARQPLHTAAPTGVANVLTGGSVQQCSAVAGQLEGWTVPFRKMDSS